MSGRADHGGAHPSSVSSILVVQRGDQTRLGEGRFAAAACAGDEEQDDLLTWRSDPRYRIVNCFLTAAIEGSVGRPIAGHTWIRVSGEVADVIRQVLGDGDVAQIDGSIDIPTDHQN